MYSYPSISCGANVNYCKMRVNVNYLINPGIVNQPLKGKAHSGETMFSTEVNSTLMILMNMMMMMLLLMMMTMLLLMIMTMMVVMMMMIYDINYLQQLLTIEVFWRRDQLRITAFPEHGDNC